MIRKYKQDDNKRTRKKNLNMRVTEKEKEIVKLATAKSQKSTVDTVMMLLKKYLEE